MAQHPYTAKALSRSPKGAIKGEIYEGDVLIATFSKPAQMWYGTTVKFFSSQARARFDDFADCLSWHETIEAIMQVYNIGDTIQFKDGEQGVIVSISKPMQPKPFTGMRVIVYKSLKTGRDGSFVDGVSQPTVVVRAPTL